MQKQQAHCLHEIVGTGAIYDARNLTKLMNRQPTVQHSNSAKENNIGAIRQRSATTSRFWSTIGICCCPRSGASVACNRTRAALVLMFVDIVIILFAAQVDKTLTRSISTRRYQPPSGARPQKDRYDCLTTPICDCRDSLFYKNKLHEDFIWAPA